MVYMMSRCTHIVEAENNLRMKELSLQERSEMQAQQRGLIERVKSLTLEIEETDKKIWANEIKWTHALNEVCNMS